MTMTVGLTVSGNTVTVTVPPDADVKIERILDVHAAAEVAEPRGTPGDWEAIVQESEYVDVELDFCRRAEDLGWVVERSTSKGVHAKDINIYPPVGLPRVRIAVFYAPSGRVAFPNRVHEEDRRADRGIHPIYDYGGTPRETFTGLFIQLRRPSDVDAAMALAQVVYERIIL